MYADLCLADVLHREVEPDSEAGVARIGSDEEVKFKLTDVVDAAQIPCRGSETAYISINYSCAVQSKQSRQIISSACLTIGK